MWLGEGHVGGGPAMCMWGKATWGGEGGGACGGRAKWGTGGGQRGLVLATPALAICTIGLRLIIIIVTMFGQRHSMKDLSAQEFLSFETMKFPKPPSFQAWKLPLSTIACTCGYLETWFISWLGNCWTP